MNRSILKWVGGKGRVVDELKKEFGQPEVFVEPFVGGGSVFMNTNYPRYFLSDCNPDLVAVLHVASEAPEELIEECEMLWSKGSDVRAYMSLRDAFNSDPRCVDDMIQTAARFIYLNRHGYNGLCRYNSSGQYNVPFGKHNSTPYLPKTEIIEFSRRCSNSAVVIKQLDYLEAIEQAPSGAMIYADPPYIPTTKTATFTAYHKAPFNQQSHRLLAQALKKAVERGCSVVLSNSNTLLTKDIYYGFVWREVRVGRYLGADPKTRDVATELIGVLKP